jgi:hypothetical protein
MAHNKLLRSVRIVELVEVGILEGDGTEEDLNRIVLYYSTKDGRVLFRIDDWEAQEALEG